MRWERYPIEHLPSRSRMFKLAGKGVVEAKVYCANLHLSSEKDPELSKKAYSRGIAHLKRAYEKDRKHTLELLLNDNSDSAKYCLSYYYLLEAVNEKDKNIKATLFGEHEKHLLEGAESGHLRSMLDLGFHYQRIDNYNKAINWYQRAAVSAAKFIKSTSPLSPAKLQCYYPTLEPYDYSEQHKVLIIAHTKLAEIYGYGLGKIPKDIKKAMEYLNHEYIDYDSRCEHLKAELKKENQCS